MCAPLAIMGVTAAVNIASEGIAAKAKDTAAERAWGSAQGDLMGKYNATQLRENQEMQRTQLQVFQAQKQARSTASRLRAQSAAGGVAGATAQEREAQPGNAATDFGATARINLANELKQNQADASSFRAQAQSVINENQPESGAALALGTASALLPAAGAAAQGGMPGASKNPLEDVQAPTVLDSDTAAAG